MKALFILLIFATLALIFWAYQKERDSRKLSLSLLIFLAVGGFAVLGMMLRPMIILFLVHFALLIASWLSLFWYILKGRYYPLIHLSPLATLLLYVISEFLFGSGGLDLV
ncbi:MAG: hypothetical protein JXQ76_04575 [Campylobacterales bacterium]|nr:hypothetical protein [Campylobacterales bacterium]